MDEDLIDGGTVGPSSDLIDPVGNQPAPQNDSSVDGNGDQVPAPAQGEPPVPQEDKYVLPDGREVDKETAIKEFQKFYPDYTRKAQEAKRAKELEEQNLQLRELLNNINKPNPDQNLSKEEIEAKQIFETLTQQSVEKARKELMPQIEELKVQNECVALKAKYPDFDQDAVLNYAIENRLAHNLESAYLLLNREAHIEKARKEAETATATNMSRKAPGGVIAGTSNAAPGPVGLRPYNKETDASKSYRELLQEGLSELGLR